MSALLVVPGQWLHDQDVSLSPPLVVVILGHIFQRHLSPAPAQILPAPVDHRHGDPERFYAQVHYQGKLWGEGKGPSIKQAEQQAAQLAYQQLQPLIAAPATATARGD